ncbi:hypothetical protein PBRA_009209 [Plasmodiophora brassicae]|uniref:Peptidase S54 rhomboid domain-containing protein n=1 Tax=Plasmodiophora brassicae TaxID=37360 RepID=A0A0G4J6S5_PLABS|nr:hypothetical protein PBRA_009209 [Plasmodiophora brassicae]
MRWPADRPARGLVLIEHESVLERVKRKWDASSETTRTLTVLTAANAAVFGLWHVRAPAIRRVLERYFTSRPESRRIVPHLLSGFSHQSGAHLAFNMIALSFGSVVHNTYGREQFCFLYLSSIIASSVFSHVYASRLGRLRPSLGASGGVLALVSVCTVLRPDAQLMLIFLPFVSFPAWAALAGMFAFDTCGILLGWQMFDHAAHLGGLLAGYLYASKLKDLTWDRRRWLTDRLGVQPARRPPSSGTY